MPEKTDTLEDEILDTENLDNQEPDEEEDESSEDTPSESKSSFESRYKDLQGAYTKSQQSNKAMERQLAELSGKVDAFTQMSTVAEGDWLDESGDDDDPDDYWRNDPSVARKAMKRFRKEMADVLEQRDAYIMNEVGKMAPVDSTLKDKIEELRDDPEFQDFPQKALSSIAKKLIGKKVIHRPPGSPGHGKKSAGTKASKVEDSPMFKAMYGSTFEETE